MFDASRDVYDRQASHDPSEDSIVRGQARRLRQKLKQYYESAGKDNPALIYYRPGSNVPVFRPRCSQGGDGTVTDAEKSGIFFWTCKCSTTQQEE
jgi:hypothetical protein